MTDINLKTLTPDTSLPTTGFLFGADSQASTNPSVYSTQTVATTLLGSTSLTGDTVATSLPVLDLAQTWNSSGTTFTGVRFNAAGSSSTNSAAASLLMDLQVGGTSKFSVTKTGILALSSAIEGQGYVSANNGFYINSNGTSVGIWFGTSADTILTRKGAANLQLGAADAASPIAQTLSVQSIVGGISTNASAAAYPFTINGAQGTGTGAGGSIVFKVAPAGGSGNAQNTLAAALTIDSTKLATFANGVFVQSNNITLSAGAGLLWTTRGTIYSAADGIISLYNNSLSDFNRLQFGGVTSSFPSLKRSTTSLQARLADDSAFTNIQGKLTTDNAYAVGGVLAATGSIIIYDSTGTAYRVPCLV